MHTNDYIPDLQQQTEASGASRTLGAGKFTCSRRIHGHAEAHNQFNLRDEISEAFRKRAWLSKVENMVGSSSHSLLDSMTC